MFRKFLVLSVMSFVVDRLVAPLARPRWKPVQAAAGAAVGVAPERGAGRAVDAARQAAEPKLVKRTAPPPGVSPELHAMAAQPEQHTPLAKVWAMVKAAGTSWSDDYAPSMGAALAYYTLFSIAPLLLLVISIAGLVFGEDAARGGIMAQLQGLLGREQAAAIESLLQSASKPTHGVIGTVVGFGALVVGATTVFGELQNDLDRIWRAPPRTQSGVWKLLQTRLLSFGLILSIGFLLIVSLVASAAITALGNWWGDAFMGWQVLAQIANLVLGFVVITAGFAAIYKIMPRVQIAWRDVWVGAAVTAGLFTLGRFLIGLYLGNSSVVSGFGAASSLVLLLVWVYYSAQIFLVGAEFTWVYAHSFGSRRNQPKQLKRSIADFAGLTTAR